MKRSRVFYVAVAIVAFLVFSLIMASFRTGVPQNFESFDWEPHERIKSSASLYVLSKKGESPIFFSSDDQIIDYTIGKEYEITLLDRDLFWDTERCSQMKSVFVGGDIFFRDYIRSKNGEWRDILYMYVSEKNEVYQHSLLKDEKMLGDIFSNGKEMFFFTHTKEGVFATFVNPKNKNKIRRKKVTFPETEIFSNILKEDSRGVPYMSILTESFGQKIYRFNFKKEDFDDDVAIDTSPNVFFDEKNKYEKFKNTDLLLQSDLFNQSSINLVRKGSVIFTNKNTKNKIFFIASK